jgi:signal transduction histidine kinase
MKIGQRLAIRFTIVSALLTGAILIITYVITRRVVHSDFTERLSQQSRWEVVHYATPDVRDVAEPGSFLLLNPYTKIYSLEGTLLYSQGELSIPTTWITFLQTNNVFNAERGEISTVGRKYTIQGKTYLVFVSAADHAGAHELDILMKAMSAGWLVSLVLAYLAGLYFSSNALQPVKHVVHDVNKITEENLSYRLRMEKDLSQVDEIDELILTFNALLNRIEKAFIAQKRFVQHASHELKTPLTAIMAEAELALARDRDITDYKRTLNVVLDETERLVRTTQGLLSLARIEEGSYQSEVIPISITKVCRTAVDTTKIHHPTRTIILNEPAAGDLQVLGNMQLLEIALINLLDNAIKYSAEEVIVSLHQGKEVVITIKDKGIGIPVADLERITSPLYRASNVSNIQGAGLGLSLVERIVSLHAGSLKIESAEGSGTSCIVKLPLFKAQSS